jgi:exonuclease III
MGKYGWVNENLGRTLLTSWLEDDVATQQIDYVLFRPKKRWLVDDVKVIEEPTASDHFPIIMKLKLIK